MTDTHFATETRSNAGRDEEDFPSSSAAGKSEAPSTRPPPLTAAAVPCSGQVDGAAAGEKRETLVACFKTFRRVAAAAGLRSAAAGGDRENAAAFPSSASNATVIDAISLGGIGGRGRGTGVRRTAWKQRSGSTNLASHLPTWGDVWLKVSGKMRRYMSGVRVRVCCREKGAACPLLSLVLHASVVLCRR